MFENCSEFFFLVFLIFKIFSTKCENSMLLKTTMHLIFNFPIQMFQFIFFGLEKPISSADQVFQIRTWNLSWSVGQGCECSNLFYLRRPSPNIKTFRKWLAPFYNSFCQPASFHLLNSQKLPNHANLRSKKFQTERQLKSDSISVHHCIVSFVS